MSLSLDPDLWPTPDTKIQVCHFFDMNLIPLQIYPWYQVGHKKHKVFNELPNSSNMFNFWKILFVSGCQYPNLDTKLGKYTSWYLTMIFQSG